MCSKTSKLTTVEKLRGAERQRRAVDLLNRQIAEQPAALLDHRRVDLDALRVVPFAAQQVEHPALAAADLEQAARARPQAGFAQESQVRLVVAVVVALLEGAILGRRGARRSWLLRDCAGLASKFVRIASK